MQLEELSSLPVNRCDPYNFMYFSPHSNLIVVAVSNGIHFMRLRSTKSPSSYETEILADAVQSIVPDSGETKSPTNVITPTDCSFIQTSLCFASAVEIDFQHRDPIGLYRPAFVNGLTGEKAEEFYYDNILAQKPLNRPPSSATRSLSRASGSHVVKIFSVLVNISNQTASETGVEIVIALTSTGGWYLFSCGSWPNSQQPQWQLVESWHSTTRNLELGNHPATPKKPTEVTEGFLKSLHSLCCQDLTVISTLNGKILALILNGRSEILVKVLDVVGKSPVDLSPKAQQPVTSISEPRGNLAKLPCEGSVVKICYLASSKSLVCACEDGRIYLLSSISPVEIEEGEAETAMFQFESCKLIWSYQDLGVDLMKNITISGENKILAVAKGSYLIVWVLPDLTLVTCQIDAFPITSICSSTSTSNLVVSTKKAIYSVDVEILDGNQPKISHRQVLAVEQVASPVGQKNHSQKALIDSYKRRQLSNCHWNISGFSASPSFCFFVAAVGIFSPCKPSLLLSPPFSLKVFVNKNVEKSGKHWDSSLFEVSCLTNNEAELIERSSTRKANPLDFVFLQQACFAYLNGCQQVSAPEPIVNAKLARRQELFKTHLFRIANELLPFDLESEANLRRQMAWISDLVAICRKLGVWLSNGVLEFCSKNSDFVEESRLKCPICKLPLCNVLNENCTSPFGVIAMARCSQKHIFRLCTKSLLPWKIVVDSRSGESSRVLPVFCSICGETMLRYQKVDEKTNSCLIERSVNNLLLLPCLYCGNKCLP